MLEHHGSGKSTLLHLIGGVDRATSGKVFIDGRADLYSKYNYKDSYDLASLNKNFKKVINKYKFDYYLISKDSGLNTYLKYNDNYEFIMSDKKVALYKTKE